MATDIIFKALIFSFKIWARRLIFTCPEKCWALWKWRNPIHYYFAVSCEYPELQFTRICLLLFSCTVSPWSHSSAQYSCHTFWNLKGPFWYRWVLSTWVMHKRWDRDIDSTFYRIPLGANSSWYWRNTSDSPITRGCFARATTSIGFWLTRLRRNGASLSFCPLVGVSFVCHFRLF